ncbi:NmrA domain-containing protein [Mycena indigotica]|uniref:NmrA domain-containing protein n=1 Tax=Mycena indigotica TaxID=2126181 RepID=A0A8H6SCN9_9AGAR|nr:NmrA domain-containing protein [Mycena indigotica]KAF7297028.1 NmrA domain-containing protein [Mycena indigotica]
MASSALSPVSHLFDHLQYLLNVSHLHSLRRKWRARNCGPRSCSCRWDFHPRAVSRSADSAPSKALIARGIEVGAADLFDKESLKNAVRGSEVQVVFGLAATVSRPPAEVSSVKLAPECDGVQQWPLHARDTVFIWLRALFSVIFDLQRESGIPHSILLTAWFCENVWKLGVLSSESYIVTTPKFAPEDQQCAMWVKHDLGQAALALAKNYNTPLGKRVGVLGGAFPVVSMKFTYPQLAAAIAKGISKPVAFLPVDSGARRDGAIVLFPFLFQAKIGSYHDTPVPNPTLVELEVKFAAIEEFVHWQQEVVPRFT